LKDALPCRLKQTQDSKVDMSACQQIINPPQMQTGYLEPKVACFTS